MKKLSLLLLTLTLSLSNLLTLSAQTKSEQIARIRQIYAQAKKDVTNNGKGGAAPLDVRVSRTETDATAGIEENEELQFFFKRPNNGHAICYLITRQWEADGHTDYREFLFDPVKGHLLFAFMKAETHAGFKIETRYYYDALGNCIEQKHKVQDKESTPDSHSWSDAKGESMKADNYISAFNDLLNIYDYPEIATKSMMEATPKDEIIKRIRTVYSAAKNKVALNDKKDGAKNDMLITIHDQADQDMPPMTKTLKYYYDVVQKSDTYYHCYFLSTKLTSMYGETYEEYLTDNTPERHNLIFNYCDAEGEGETLEVRYYYDANGHCVEAKCSQPDYDERAETRNRAGFYFSIFKKLYD
jgi:hypothetical protein